MADIPLLVFFLLPTVCQHTHFPFVSPTGFLNMRSRWFHRRAVIDRSLILFVHMRLVRRSEIGCHHQRHRALDFALRAACTTQQMRFTTRFVSECATLPAAFSEAHVTRLVGRIWLGLCRHDARRMRHVHANCAPLFSGRCLELDVSVVSSQTMALLPRPHHEHNGSSGDVAESSSASSSTSSCHLDLASASPPRTSRESRMRRASLCPTTTTDVIAFPDPVIDAALAQFAAAPRPHAATGGGQEAALRSALERELCSLGDGDDVGDDGGCSGGGGTDTRRVADIATQPETCGSIVMSHENMVVALGRGGSGGGGGGRGCCGRRGRVVTMDDYVQCALVHAVLHLFGYRHDSDAELEEMLAMERRLARWLALS